MTGGSAVSRRTLLIDRAAGSEQVEQPESVSGERVIQILGNPKPMASLITHSQPLAGSCGGEISKVKKMH